MIIASLTSRLDYSQGERWYNNLKSIDDLHKPDMDGIGFQSLLTTEMLCTDCVQDELLGVTETKSDGFWLDINISTIYRTCCCLFGFLSTILVVFTHA